MSLYFFIFFFTLISFTSSLLPFSLASPFLVFYPEQNFYTKAFRLQTDARSNDVLFSDTCTYRYMIHMFERIEIIRNSNRDSSSNISNSRVHTWNESSHYFQQCIWPLFPLFATSFLFSSFLKNLTILSFNFIVLSIFNSSYFQFLLVDALLRLSTWTFASRLYQDCTEY